MLQYKAVIITRKKIKIKNKNNKYNLNEIYKISSTILFSF